MWSRTSQTDVMWWADFHNQQYAIQQTDTDTDTNTDIQL